MLNRPQEPSSNQRMFQTSAATYKGKAKMLEYEVDYSHESDVDGLAHSFDSDFGVPIMRTPGVKKDLATTNEKIWRWTRGKSAIARFGYNDYMAYQYAFMIKVETVREIESFAEMARDPQWIDVMKEEMQSLDKNRTWELVPHSPCKKAIGCRWIYKVKYNAGGMINRYKSWLVAKGYAH